MYFPAARRGSLPPAHWSEIARPGAGNAGGSRPAGRRGGGRHRGRGSGVRWLGRPQRNPAPFMRNYLGRCVLAQPKSQNCFDDLFAGPGTNVHSKVGLFVIRPALSMESFKRRTVPGQGPLFGCRTHAPTVAPPFRRARWKRRIVRSSRGSPHRQRCRRRARQLWPGLA